MSEDKKSYNVLALRGQDIDDMEYVETFGLDPSLAYTPRLNDAMLDKVYQDNLEYYREEGLSEAEAVSNAKRLRAEAKRNIDGMVNKK